MLQPGQSFAHFTIVRLLGEGGMGQVYLAEDQKLHRQVALKILTWQHGESEERHARFEREAHTAAQISHPNVMAIYDIDSVTDASGEDITYIVMEYIKGKPLSEYMRTRQGDIAATVRLAEKIVSGLAAAHKMNVVHRDIKADNILVDDDDQPKILDFGLAKPVEPVQFTGGETGTKTISKELTRAGKIIGTVSYMSPEQVRGEQVDTRSDIFSFGILFYRMITGEFPFSGPTEVSTLAKILEGRPEPLRVKNETIPQELERIVDKCLQKDPNDRYQDTRDLVVDLRNLRRQYDSGVSDKFSGVTERPEPTRKPWYTNLGRRPAVLIAMALIFIYVLASKLIDRSGSHVDSAALQAKPNSLAILEFENKTGDSNFDWLQTGLPEIMLTDLAQHRGINLISRQRITETIEEYSRQGKNVDMTELRRVAAEDLGASTVLSGAYYKVGDKIRIDARLEDATSGRIILAEKVVGEDPFSLVDSLTGKIAGSMSVSQDDGSKDVASITSSSPEAYKQYILGMEKFGQDMYDDASRYFEKAIQLDSTFALPYMRLGMINAFSNHPKEASLYLATAVQHADKLPTRERTLLDIYADIWLRRKFDAAFSKMQGMVTSYPDDVEARTIYGVLLDEFTHDTVKAFAQFDTVAILSPGYEMPQSYRCEQYTKMGNYKEAASIATLIRKNHPDSPSSYQLLGFLYLKQNERDKARQEYEQLLTKYPTDQSALSSLQRLAIFERDFATAQSYLERLRVAKPNDPTYGIQYYNGMANLAEWQGQFRRARDLSLKGFQLVLQTNDSMIISQSASDLGEMYLRDSLPDSAMAMYRIALQYHTVNMFPQYYLVLAELQHKAADSATASFRKELDSFKGRIPAELWGIADGLEGIWFALLDSDTAKLIESYKTLAKAQNETNEGNIREIGVLYVKIGRYQEGIDILKKYVEGQDEVTQAFTFNNALYHLARAYEGIGKNKEAAKYYSQMLESWGKADSPLFQITDARARLTKLSS